MNPTSLQQISQWCSGKVAQAKDACFTITHVDTDTRSITSGSLFVALTGERFDGHKFLAEAHKKGCAAALVTFEGAQHAPKDLPLIIVKDTLESLQLLAQNSRQTLTSPVVCITGSSGKTSVKNLLNAALQPLGKTQATKGNLNNHIGLPLSVLEGDDTHAAHTWELGMNHPGEIAPLASIASPNAAIITNIGTAHIEHLGSRESIAREKAELLTSLPESGLAVLPADDDFRDLLTELTPCRTIYAGFDPNADYQVVDYKTLIDGCSFVLKTPRSEVSIRLPIQGRHMAINAALATALACEIFAIDPTTAAAALTKAKMDKGRLTPIEHKGVLLIDDSYNANPESTAAALRTLAELPLKSSSSSQKRIAVLGKMNELGEHELPAYRQLADLAGELEIDAMYTVGEEWEQALQSSRHSFELHLHQDTKSCAQTLQNNLQSGDLVLVKGSRGAAMEQVIQQITSQ